MKSSKGTSYQVNPLFVGLSTINPNKTPKANKYLKKYFYSFFFI